MTKDEELGRDSIRKRISQGEVLLTFTDKDSRMVLCPPEVYKEAAKVHTSKDEVVSWDTLAPTIQTMNRTAKALVRMFRIGQDGTSSQRERINKAVITPDTAPPGVNFLWKTHKDYTTIPPTRPVCDASQGPLARSSNLVTTILTPIMESRMFLEECDSTEDMLAAVDKANQTLRDNPPSTGEVSIISMDAEALYPSLALKDILDSIWTLITTSHLQFKNINTKELGKYLAVMVDEDILKKHKVISSIPRRQAVIEGRGRRKPTLAFLDKSTYTKTINGESQGLP